MAERTPVQRLRISADEAGQRLDNYVARQFRHLPRSVIYRLIRKGQVRVNGGRRQPRDRLAASDEVRLPPVDAPDSTEPGPVSPALAQGLLDRVLFENAALLVLDKPQGLAVHGGSGVRVGAIEALRQSRDVPFLELVHRLDRDTSGCLAIAKSRAALRELQAAFRERRVRKRYRLLVSGAWPADRLQARAPLERYLSPNGERRVRVSAQGLASRTDFERVRLSAGYSEVIAHLHTGRTHQIRVHCQHQGHVVLGDVKYAAADQRSDWAAAGLNELALHAERLRMPFGEALIDVTAPLPTRFERLGRIADELADKAADRLAGTEHRSSQRGKKPTERDER